MNNPLANLTVVVSLLQVLPAVVAAQLLPPSLVPGKELSNHRDVNQSLSPDDLQNLGWDGLGNRTDAFDYSTSGPPPLDPDQVDALANNRDYLFQQLLNNQVPMVLSFQGYNNVHYHSPGGSTGIWASATQVSAPVLSDVDALELYSGDVGQVGGAGFDAVHFSIIGDAIPPVPPGGMAPISVYYYEPSIDKSFVYIPHQDILNQVSAFLHRDLSEIDVDAMMILDLEGPPPGGPDGLVPTFDPGDTILFSLWPDSQAGLDGGEIFVWQKGVSFGYLVHGGRVWDTANPVASLFNVNTENINALEAVTPEPTSLMVVLAMSGWTMCRSRHRATAG